MNGLNNKVHVKNELIHDTPIIIGDNVTSSGISLLALWNTYADKGYMVRWPEDKRLPLIASSTIAVFTKQGYGELELHNGEILELKGASIVFLDPMTIKHYFCKGLIWDLFWIEFIPNGVMEISYGEIIQLDTLKKLENEFNQISVNLVSKRQKLKELAVASLTKIIYEWLCLIETKPIEDHQFLLVQKAISHIHLKIADHWTVKEMAEFSGCSEQHLRRLFLKFTKQSPKEYFLNTKLETAFFLMDKKNYNVNQVSIELNFYDQFHFSKSFKKKFGISPSEVIQGSERLRVNRTDYLPINNN
ncbi:helix-turn-helix transcriptional regulator [Vibrio sp. 2-Bac 85]